MSGRHRAAVPSASTTRRRGRRRWRIPSIAVARTRRSSSRTVGSPERSTAQRDGVDDHPDQALGARIPRGWPAPSRPGCRRCPRNGRAARGRPRSATMKRVAPLPAGERHAAARRAPAVDPTAHRAARKRLALADRGRRPGNSQQGGSGSSRAAPVLELSPAGSRSVRRRAPNGRSPRTARRARGRLWRPPSTRAE